jgi:hypothetical protein
VQRQHTKKKMEQNKLEWLTRRVLSNRLRTVATRITLGQGDQAQSRRAGLAEQRGERSKHRHTCTSGETVIIRGRASNWLRSAQQSSKERKDKAHE